MRADAAKQSRDAWRLAIAGVIALAAAMGIGRFVYTPILPVMAAALPLTAGEAGLIASANYAGYLLGALLGTSAMIGGRPRHLFLGAIIASGVLGIAAGLVDQLLALIVIRFIAGIASAFVIVFSSSVIIERIIALGRADLSMIQFGGVGLGIAFSAVIIAWLHYVGQSWQAMWIWTGIATLLGALAVYLLVPRGRAESATSATVGAPRPWAFRLIVVAYGLFGFGYVITATFIVAIVRGSATLAPLEPVIWLFVGLAGIPSIWLWNKLAARIGQALTFAIACLVEAVGVFLSVGSNAPTAAIAAAVLLGGTFMAITAIGLAYARTLSARTSREVFAIMTVAFSLGQMIGPSVAGYLHDLTGSFAPGSLAATAALAVAAGLAMLTRPQAGFSST